MLILDKLKKSKNKRNWYCYARETTIYREID